ncbi:MAG: MFS transporter [Oscillospiraceae bacterium]|nr:MFS transporter [Oscillospiraceae bacterium]
MSKNKNCAAARMLYLAMGTVSMLFAGVIYAWSILKMPLAQEFGWGASQLTLNFTLTMCFFCLGGFIGSLAVKKINHSVVIILSGIVAGLGFVFTSLLSGSIFVLYITYALAAGLGIGVAYNVIISSVNAWFPDKRGLSSGCLLMGFGISTLLFGNIFDVLFSMPEIGWRKAYVLFGIVIAVVLIASGIIIKRPAKDTVLPQPKKNTAAKEENFENKDYTTLDMVKRFTFWRAFVCLVCLCAVGNSVISFAKDLVVSVGAAASFATTMVGVLAVCNGLGRIITGAVFDRFGRRITMIGSNIVTIAAAGITLLAVLVHSLPICIVGLCLTGISYGSSPTVSSAFIAAFYGQKYFATNYSVMNFHLTIGSFMATACSSLLTSSGSYIAPFVLLLSLACAALILNFSIRRP